MIHVKRSTVVPAAFTSSAIKMDIKKYRAFFRRSGKSRSQEGFKEAINGDTHGTLNAVAEQFNFKCAACERKLTIHNVISDSWRPRTNAKGFDGEFAPDHYWWLAYVWQNKYALCVDCNKFKGTWFPVEGRRAPIESSYASIVTNEKALLLDPCRDYPEEHLVVEDDGTLLQLTRKGEVTIELFKLNRADLLSQRRATIRSVKKLLQQIEKLWADSKTGKAPQTQQKLTLTKLNDAYKQVAEWLKRNPTADFVLPRRQVVILWLFMKPDYHNATALKKCLPKATHYVAFMEIESIFRKFHQLLVNKTTQLPGFKPAAILKPNASIISKPLPAEKKKKAAIRKIPSGSIPTNNLSNLIKEGLKAASSFVAEPIAGAIAGTAAELLGKAITQKQERLYPEKVEIRNFKSIASLQFDFKVPEPGLQFLGMTILSHNEPWKFLLGENGVGKSSILQAIALVLAGDKYVKKLQIDPADILRHGTKKGWVKIWFSGREEPAILQFDNKTMHSNFKTGTINVLGYGSTRVLPKPDSSLQPEEHTSSAKIRNLFDYGVSLADVRHWMLTIDTNLFDKVARALKDVLDLPSTRTYFIRKADQIYFSESKETLHQLSEGYRSVIALAVDIMKSLSDDIHPANSAASKKMPGYDAMEGIVLVDEISSHLHPRWQMRIVRAFRKAFPKLQFIVTSHDPLSLKGIENGEVLLLRKQADDTVIGIENLPNPAELRAEQLLTSEFFGLSSTLDPDLEIQFNTYHHLLAKTKRTANEKKQLEELTLLLKGKQHLGDTLREELMYNVIDSRLAQNANSRNPVGREELFDDTKKKVIDLWDKLYK
jgi:predicted ATPase